METKPHMQVANTILAQIRGNRLDKRSGTHIMMCWGARNFVAIPASSGNRGSLRMRVDGRKHVGYVDVILAADDTYTVELLDLQGKVVKSTEFIYDDRLLEVIDWYVET